MGIKKLLMRLEQLIVEKTRLEAAVTAIGWDVPIQVGFDSVLIGDRINQLTSQIEQLRIEITEGCKDE